jgi:hypothetical protein
LDGVVKPYDVLALMTVLPQARAIFAPRFVYRGVSHLLLLEPAHAIAAEPVVLLLRETYHEVVSATAERARWLRRGSADSKRLRSAGALDSLCAAATPFFGRGVAALSPSRAQRHSFEMRTDLRDVLLGLRDAEEGAAASAEPGAREEARGRGGKVRAAQIERLLASAIELAVERRERLDRLVRLVGGGCLLTCSMLFVTQVLGDAARALESAPATACRGGGAIASRFGAAGRGHALERGDRRVDQLDLAALRPSARQARGGGRGAALGGDDRGRRVPARDGRHLLCGHRADGRRHCAALPCRRRRRRPHPRAPRALRD